MSGAGERDHPVPSGSGAPAGPPAVTAARRRVMSEAQVVAMAASAWVGAIAAWPVPVPPAALGAVLALVARRPLLLTASVGVLACGLGHRSDLAFQPVEAGQHRGWVSLVGDPRPIGVGWRSVVRLADGRRVELSGYGQAGGELGRHLAGDRLQVEGRLAPVDDRPWTRSRHLVGRMSLDRVTAAAGPGPVLAAVERVRALVAGGADPLPEALRPLYLGLVIGDDRYQSPEQQARFRAAGLTHLLAVSGQNVAFVLSVARPLSDLVGRRGRFLVTGLLLIVFAMVTRLEPSVLRATATAGLASWAALTGHRQSGLRLLGLAVTALVLIDPFLVYSVGFQLSIGASAGILVLGPAIAARLRGPSLVTEPLAVTLAAQVAVLPLLMGYFGPVSVASVPANLLAGWAAGAVMTWGLTGGVIAGTLPEPLAGWLQRPAWVLVWWLDSVAAWAARLPLPALEPRLLPVAVGLAGSAWLLGGSRARPPDRPVSGSGGRTGRVGVLTAGRAVARLALVAAVAAVAAGAVPRPPATMTELEGGGRWIPGGPDHPSILIVNASADDRLLDEVTGRRILAVDIVVAESGTGPGARLVSAATDITAAGLVLAPPQHRIVGARRVTAELTIATATGNMTITPSANRLSASLLEPAPHAPADG